MQEIALNYTVAGIIFSVVLLSFLFGLVQSLANNLNSSNIFIHILSGLLAIGQGSVGTILCITITWYFEKIEPAAIVMLYIMLPMGTIALFRYYPEQAKQLLITIINRFTKGKP